MLGIFDSGIGGLTVVKSIFEILPQYQIMYLGDTARLPYGSRSADLIYKFTVEGIDFLFQRGCHLIILACNTSSAQALRKIQQEYLPAHYSKKRVLGVIRPLAEEAARVTTNNRVGVIGTAGTMQSEAYIRELRAQNSNIKVFQQPCPLFVPLIEEGWARRAETRKIAKYYLRPLKLSKIDTLILGCTHYETLFSLIQEIIGRRAQVLKSGEIIAQSLRDYLQKHIDIESKLIRGENHKYLVTDITSSFLQNSRRFLGREIELEKVKLN